MIPSAPNVPRQGGAEGASEFQAVVSNGRVRCGARQGLDARAAAGLGEEALFALGLPKGARAKLLEWAAAKAEAARADGPVPPHRVSRLGVPR